MGCVWFEVVSYPRWARTHIAWQRGKGRRYKNGGFVLSDMWDQNRLFSRFELSLEGQSGAREPKNGPKKEVKKGSKRLKNGNFGPFSTTV